MIRRTCLSAVLSVALLQPQVALAGSKNFAVQGYALPADKPVTIVLMRPDADIGELQAGGLPQPNAEWTSAAREQIAKALRAELGSQNISFTTMEDQVPAYRARMDEQARAAACPSLAVQPAAAPADADAASAPAPAACTPKPVPDIIDAEAEVAQYNALHRAVVEAIMAHQYHLGDSSLPTKKNNFAFTLGPGTRQLSQVSGANYGLFVLTYDQFASSGRKAMQVMGALGCIIGACVIVSGGIHVSYVSLVDLDSGNIVWFNLQRGSKGDVREEKGAQDMVHAIMTGMPSRPGQMISASSSSKHSR